MRLSFKVVYRLCQADDNLPRIRFVRSRGRWAKETWDPAIGLWRLEMLPHDLAHREEDELWKRECLARGLVFDD